MEIELTIKKKCDINYIKCDIGIDDCWQSGEVNGESEENHSEPTIPFTFTNELGEWRWQPIINVDEGKILNWPKGITAKAYYRVFDNMSLMFLNCNMQPYSWYDSYQRKMVNKYSGYVPDILCYNCHTYSEYVSLEIKDDGTIVDFDKTKLYDILTDDEE